MITEVLTEVPLKVGGPKLLRPPATNGLLMVPKDAHVVRPNAAAYLYRKPMAVIRINPVFMTTNLLTF